MQAAIALAQPNNRLAQATNWLAQLNILFAQAVALFQQAQLSIVNVLAAIIIATSSFMAFK
ncbi:MAG: hypothetical protein IPJ79_04855 [Bacteroidetes bacterium]|nr:hypothetical protein [Bacteroidota bacterium]HNR18659.1 hypothetical protein [Bacteroidia bacterium]HNU33415.1 hypothetical protein [Bacteroidia bacterium]